MKICQIEQKEVTEVPLRFDAFYSRYSRKTMRGPFDPPTCARVNLVCQLGQAILCKGFYQFAHAVWFQ